MKYLLDTNVASELMKSEPDPLVKKWVVEHADDTVFSAFVVAELASGVEAMPEGKRRAAITREIRFLQEDYAEEILVFDESIAWEWARYIREAHACGFAPSLMDSLIAATARAWDLKLVTRNVSDFPLIEVINPFKP